MIRRAVSLAAVSLVLSCGPDEAPSASPSPDAVYRLVSIDGTAVPYRATLQFAQTGEISGQAPCNRYSAAQSATLPAIRIEAIAATRMACPDLPAETQFFDALQSVTLAEVSGQTLVLSGPVGPVMVFQTP